LIASFPDENVDLESCGYMVRQTDQQTAGNPHYDLPNQMGPHSALSAGRETAGVVETYTLPEGQEHDRFVAAHVSADGRDLVATSDHGIVYFIDNFERFAFRRNRAGSDASSSDTPPRKEVVYWYTCGPSVDQPAYNLAFEGGRVAVTCRNGIFIFNLKRPGHIFNKSTEHPVIEESREDSTHQAGMEPFISPVKVLKQFVHPLALELTSWTALSGDSFWTTWHPVVRGGVFADFPEQTLVRVKMV